MSAYRVLAFVPDLMDRSKLTAALSTDDASLQFVSVPAALSKAAGDADVALVDLGRFGALEVLASLAATIPVIAFGPHVDRELLDAARAAGCRLVLPRSQFFADIAATLAAAASGPCQ